ncbi:hypothetical protein EG856_02170 [Mycoplasmopsis phocirhinis]|uniref:Uncharacterized protein n=1 Tax=Mycoplasmopsis phocirhinis TaxID=142650 RepID=A0A4P6MNT5_9BACT|nr:hypothetical protein [Mycoplasmopsis phocirhinis]QBF34713.1 hypothetical protein EG856_02170 [Mycoplasmopsis phocirhinis]
MQLTQNQLIELNAEISQQNKNFNKYNEIISSIVFIDETIKKWVDKKIILSVKSKQDFNEFADEINEINFNYNVLSEIEKEYLSNDLNEGLFLDLKNELENFKQNFNTEISTQMIISTQQQILKKLTTIILNNNLVTESKKQIKDQIKEDILDLYISQADFEILNQELINSVSNEQINNIKNKIINFQTSFENNKSASKQILKNSSLNDEIRTHFLSKLEISKNFIEFEQTKNEIKELKDIIERLLMLQSEYNTKIVNKIILGQKAYELRKINIEIAQYFKDNNLDVLESYDVTKIKTVFNQIIENILKIMSTNFSEQESDLDLFKLETQNIFNLEYSQNVKNSEIEQYINQLSFDLKKANLIFNHFDNNLATFEIINLKLSGDDLDILNVEVKAKMKNNDLEYSFNLAKKFDFNAQILLNALNYNYLDDIFDVNYQKLSTYTAENFINLPDIEKTQLITVKNSTIGKYFKYRLGKVIDIENDNKLSNIIEIYWNNQIVKRILLRSKQQINFAENEIIGQQIKDKLDLEKILQIVNGDKSRFFENISFKNLANRDTHLSYLASQAIEVFDRLYNLPTFGKYSVFIKKLSQIDDYNGRTNFRLWYKIDGREAPGFEQNLKNQNEFSVDGFQLENFFDVHPENFEYNEDFFNNQQYIKPDQQTLNLIETINETNFEWRKLQTVRQINASRDLFFRQLNPKNFIEQKAFNKFEYLIELKNYQAKTIQSSKDLNIIGSQQDNLYSEQLTPNLNDITQLRADYYTYYYDFEFINRYSLNFKIGFINKKNHNIRYSSAKKYTLINLVNDFEQYHYPSIILNQLQYSDININYEQINNLNQINIENLNKYISVRGENNLISYNNFDYPTTLFKIKEFKILNNQLYVRFGVKAWDPYTNTTRRDVLSASWIRISTQPINEEIDLNLFNFNGNHNLKTLKLSPNKIVRERIIEQYYKDVFWQHNKKTNSASWTLLKKYLDKTFLQPNTTQRSIKLHLYANVLFFDENKVKRINDENQGLNLTIDFEQLLKQKNQYFDWQTTINETEKLEIRVVYEWDENEGIKFRIYPKNSDYKIKVEISDLVQNKQYTNFDAQNAFIIHPSGAKITLHYVNNVEEENFGTHTNQINYNKVLFTQVNQPITIYNPETEYEYNHYNPNQNVDFKLHSGYKLNSERFRYSEYQNNELSKSTYDRSLLLRYISNRGTIISGTASVIAKVNSDPNDYKFYLITNRHVNGGDLNDFSQIKDENLLLSRKNRTLAFVTNLVGNKIIHNYNYNNITNRVSGLEEKLIYVGINQSNETDNNTNLKPDLSVFVVDLKQEYLKAKRNGYLFVAWKIENLMQKTNVNLDINYHYTNIISPVILPSVGSGYPSLNLTSWISNRPKFINGNSVRFETHSYFPSINFSSGSSGSGFYTTEDSLLGLINVVVTNYVWTQGPLYAGKDFNYLGINFDGQNPLELQNKNSLGLQILRASLAHPNEYDLPWFYKNLN